MKAVGRGQSGMSWEYYMIGLVLSRAADTGQLTSSARGVNLNKGHIKQHSVYVEH